MTSRRKANDPNLIRCHIPLSTFSAHDANRTLRVLQWCRMSIPFPTMAIVTDKSRYAERIQPIGNLLTFMIGRQVAVPASRQDDHRSPSRLVRGRRMENQLRSIFRLVP
jgi:hypothetical protein